MFYLVRTGLLLAILLSVPAAFAEDRSSTDSEQPAPTFNPAAEAVLTLPEAIDRVIAMSPRLKASQAAVEARQGSDRQAQAFVNPEAAFEAENFAGNGVYKGYDSAETTLAISQLLEVGGKRSARQRYAQQAVALARIDHEGTRLDLIRDVTLAYIDVLVAQAATDLAKNQETLAGQVLESVTRRVDAAREPLLQKSKAEIAVSTSRFNHERAKRELMRTRHVLVSLWDGREASPRLDERYLAHLDAPLTQEELEAQMDSNPSLARWKAQQSQLEAAYALEQAQAIPDPRLSVGIRDSQESGNQALIAAIALPIPVLNRNEGNIDRARKEIIEAENLEKATYLQLRGSLVQALETMMNAYSQADHLQSAILPAAKKAFKLSRQGYGAGKLSYIEVLDAQRTLFEAREQLIATQKDYHSARAEIERLTGAHSLQANAKGTSHAH